MVAKTSGRRKEVKLSGADIERRVQRQERRNQRRLLESQRRKRLSSAEKEKREQQALALEAAKVEQRELMERIAVSEAAEMASREAELNKLREQARAQDPSPLKVGKKRQQMKRQQQAAAAASSRSVPRASVKYTSPARKSKELHSHRGKNVHAAPYSPQQQQAAGTSFVVPGSGGNNQPNIYASPRRVPGGGAVSLTSPGSGSQRPSSVVPAAGLPPSSPLSPWSKGTYGGMSLPLQHSLSNTTSSRFSTGMSGGARGDTIHVVISLKADASDIPVKQGEGLFVSSSLLGSWDESQALLLAVAPCGDPRLPRHYVWSCTIAAPRYAQNVEYKYLIRALDASSRVGGQRSKVAVMWERLPLHCVNRVVNLEQVPPHVSTVHQQDESIEFDAVFGVDATVASPARSSLISPGRMGDGLFGGGGGVGGQIGRSGGDFNSPSTAVGSSPPLTMMTPPDLRFLDEPMGGFSSESGSAKMNVADIWGDSTAETRMDEDMDLLYMRPQGSPTAAAAARNFNQNLLDQAAASLLNS